MNHGSNFQSDLNAWDITVNFSQQFYLACRICSIFFLLIVVVWQFGLLQFWRGADRKEENQGKERQSGDSESQVTQGQGREYKLPFVLRTFVSGGERKQSRGTGVAEDQSLSHTVTTLARLGCSVHGFRAPWIPLKYALSQVCYSRSYRKLCAVR